MSWLLFLDESGHDRRAMPYEVTGGIALRDRAVWPFLQDMSRAETELFGASLHSFQAKLKGARLLDKDRFRWAAKGDAMPADARVKHCRGFFGKGLEKKKKPPTSDEFAAYGQACLEMARRIFQMLHKHEARALAVMVPSGAARIKAFPKGPSLRSDHAKLLDMFARLLDETREHGLLAIDAGNKSLDRQLFRRLEPFCAQVDRGKEWATRLTPAPLLVSSEWTNPVQASDLALYCVNWAFRRPADKVDAKPRADIDSQFGGYLKDLPFEIAYIPEPVMQTQ